jgi:uncharacterized phiE125 gp8 family phage protein
MNLSRVTAPAVKPVSLTEAKAHLRVDHDDENAVIDGLIDAAVSHLDGYGGVLGRCMISQQWRLALDAFPCGAIVIPLGPLIAVQRIDYYDPDGVPVTVASTEYTVDTLSRDGLVAPTTSWPSPDDRTSAVTVDFTCGFGASPSDVPAAIRNAMLLLIGHWHIHREAVGEGSFAELPAAARALLMPWRRDAF